MIGVGRMACYLPPMRAWVMASALGILLASPLAAEEIVGKARVVNGHTIEIGGRLIKLEGILAPDDFQERCTWKGEVINPAQVAADRLREIIGDWGDGTVICWTGGSPLYESENSVVAICRTAGQCDDWQIEKDKALAFNAPLYLRTCKPERVLLGSAMLFGGFALAWRDLPGNADFEIQEDYSRRENHGLWASDCFLFPEASRKPLEHPCGAKARAAGKSLDDCELAPP